MKMATAIGNNDWEQLINNRTFIGSGAYGNVYGPFVWKSKTCAVKNRMFGEKENGEREHKACEKWRSLNHRNLISVYDVSFSPPALYIVMEYAGGGTLRKVLDSYTSDLPLKILTDWGIQIAEGMKYLHGENIVHRDLKSQNIIIMESDAAVTGGKTIKIIDFDQVRVFGHTTRMTMAGTYAWMAPEVLRENQFSKASDVWSYGVILWEMSTREVPYKGVADQAIMLGVLNNTLKLTVPDLYPDNIKPVLEACLRYERDQRPTFDKIPSKFKLSRIGLYPMNSRPRGMCLIVNIANFDKGHRHLMPRRGAEKDADLIKKLFKDLHFEVQVHNDVSAATLEFLFLRMHIADHTNYDAFVCCIMTHGKLGVIYTSDGNPVEILKLVDYLTDKNCPTLKGKPKMFFIQACQKGDPELENDAAGSSFPRDDSGEDSSSSQNTASDSASNMENHERVEEGISSIQEGISNIVVTEVEPAIQEDASNSPNVSKLNETLPTIFRHKAVFVPGSPDFLMSYSTLPGSISYRDTHTGSLYIQALCDCLRGDMEIDRALKMVSSNVREKLRQRGEDDGVQDRFQLPFHLTSGMDKLIYL